MYGDWLPDLVRLAAEAGEAILEVYDSDFSVEIKADDSPLTQADLAAHRVIVAGLTRLTPDIPILSEESEAPAYSVRKDWERYWLIDPLDGTKEFVNRNGEFTVNIALIVGHAAVLGIVGLPTQSLVYTGDTAEGVARRFDLNDREAPPKEINGRAFKDANALAVVASRSHGGERLEAYIGSLGARFGNVERTPVGSSLKLCILAEGRADIYPRLAPTSEWDIAAAHAVLSAAGGDLWAANGEPLEYNAKESLLNPEFIAVADQSFDWRRALPLVPSKDA
jgi:3'(2'), 5'-bisphosphate nucleotidase